MSKPNISIGSLGGTISMTQVVAGKGITPKLSAQDLVMSIPGLDEVAHIKAQSILSVPSGYISFAHVLECLQWAQEQIAQGADGIVLTQGTDTLEETAFLLDLMWPHEQPLILMGAMRSPQKAGAEGPANLLASVITAASANSRGRGVMVVMNDWIHEARWVQKTHTANVDAFQSQVGVAGQVAEDRCVYFKAKPKRVVLPKVNQVQDNQRQVFLWTDALSESADMLECLLESKRYQGIVFAGFGAGHVSDVLASKLAELVKVMPVIMCSRTGRGVTAYSTYGYVGAEIDLIGKGVIMGGWLTPIKARLLLWVILNNELPLSVYQQYIDSMVY